MFVRLCDDLESFGNSIDIENVMFDSIMLFLTTIACEESWEFFIGINMHESMKTEAFLI